MTYAHEASARDHDGNADEPHDSRRDDGSRLHIAVDFDANAAVNTPGTNSGGGGALRVGNKLDLFLISLTPEIGGGYHAFGGPNDARLYSGFVGGRLGVGKILEPSIFGHLGVGHVSGIEDRTAPLMDVGLALDLTLLPLIDLGVHGGYNAMFPRDNGTALKFMTVGAQAALVL